MRLLQVKRRCCTAAPRDLQRCNCCATQRPHRPRARSKERARARQHHTLHSVAQPTDAAAGNAARGFGNNDSSISNCSCSSSSGSRTGHSCHRGGG